MIVMMETAGEMARERFELRTWTITAMTRSARLSVKYNTVG
jgi:hypothetical protein